MSANEKILVVRVGRGGDLVMITPPLNALLDAFPDAELHLMTHREGRRVMNGYHPRLTRVWEYHRRFFQSTLLRRKLVPQLENERYARVYVFETNPHYGQLLGALAPAVYCLDDRLAGEHYCARCLEMVGRTIDKPVLQSWVTLPVVDDARAAARVLLDENGIGSDAILIGLHPTFSGSSLPLFGDRKGMRHRTWPPDHYAELARRIHDESSDLPVRIVIDALPEERALVEPIVEKSGGTITLLSAPPNFERYKALLERIDLLVTPNTGPMHIAAAVGTRLVALFSEWSPQDCGPYVPPEKYEVLRAEDTEQPQKGLAAIGPHPVAKAVLRLLASSD